MLQWGTQSQIWPPRCRNNPCSRQWMSSPVSLSFLLVLRKKYKSYIIILRQITIWPTTICTTTITPKHFPLNNILINTLIFPSCICNITSTQLKKEKRKGVIHAHDHVHVLLPSPRWGTFTTSKWRFYHSWKKDIIMVGGTW